jgi:hypothetical protein
MHSQEHYSSFQRRYASDEYKRAHGMIPILQPHRQGPSFLERLQTLLDKLSCRKCTMVRNVRRQQGRSVWVHDDSTGDLGMNFPSPPSTAHHYRAARFVE